MSKKRILSNGYSSYWKDDIPVEKPVQKQETQFFTNVDLNRLLKQELKRRYGNSNN